MSRLGTITFQSNDSLDIFTVIGVYEDGLSIPDEELMQVEDAQFESDKAWITGNVPNMKPVFVNGDNTNIRAWFKGEFYDKPFVITVYLECEASEELMEVEIEAGHEEDTKADLEPVEVNL
jgi:hypothetical protein